MKKIVSLVLTLALIFTFSVSANAVTGSSAVQFQVSDTDIDVTVPLQVVGTVGADGQLTFPTTAKIVNNSVFPVRVSGIACTPEDGWVLSQTEGTEDNTIVSSIKGNAQTTGYPLITTAQTPDANWNMAASGGGATSEVALAFEGNVYKLKKSLTTTPATVFTITFTVSTGANT